MKTKEIRDLIEFISQTGLNEVNIETEELKLSVKREPDVTATRVVEAPVSVQAAPTPAAAPAPNPAQAPGSDAAPASEGESAGGSNAGLVEIKSPMIGTFYRSSTPDAEAFVQVGDNVSNGQTVCIVEAMKLFNEIESDVSGKIVKVLIENATPVEYDQPLFLVDPNA